MGRDILLWFLVVEKPKKKSGSCFVLETLYVLFNKQTSFYEIHYRHENSFLCKVNDKDQFFLA
jgi:hypothetical protein